MRNRKDYQHYGQSERHANRRHADASTPLLPQPAEQHDSAPTHPAHRPTGKQDWKPGTMIYPLPAVLISCGETEAEYNMMTAAWVGTTCTNPPMCYVSIRPERLSHKIISRTGEFVINLTNESMARATDWCGVRSGREVNKFEATGLTAERGHAVSAPIIAEAPLSIECRVRQVIHLGSHDMFLSDVVNVQADSRYIDPATGRFDLQAARLIAYSHGHYYALGNELGHFGWSVRRKRTASRK